jgi:AcrR family transcriptional regulator
MKVEEPNRHERRRQRTREAIIAAAAETFLRKGVANTTVADITEAADVGYGTFYNHFLSLNHVVSAVAEETMARVLRVTETILPEEEDFELLPAVSVRILVRALSHDPTIRWLLEQPYIFVEEWHKIITSFIWSVAERGKASMPNAFESLGGVEVWVRMYPWLLISELNDAIEKGSSAEHEDNLANMSIRLLGLDDARRAQIVARSREIAAPVTVPTLPRSKRT